MAGRYSARFLMQDKTAIASNDSNFDLPSIAMKQDSTISGEDGIESLLGINLVLRTVRGRG